MEDQTDILEDMVVLSDLIQDELASDRPDAELIETFAESIGLSAEKLLVDFEE